MLKFLIFLTLLVGCSFFLAEVNAIEIEILKEEERIIQSFGWLDPGKVPYQEQIQIMIGHSVHKNKITVGMMSKNQSDIKFPDDMEIFASKPKIVSFIITNQFGCAPHKITQACIIIDIERDELGDTMQEITSNTRAITDWITTGDGISLFSPTYDSVTIQPKTNLDGEKVLVSRAIYTINKQSTNNMFNALSPMLISSDIRNAGGFYEHAEKLSENNFSSFSISLIPMKDGMLRSIQISLDCSDELPELVRCPPNVTEQIARGEISPLDFIQVENISRSSIFENDFVPLNSIIQVYIFSDENLQVKSVNNQIIGKLQNLGDIQDAGWFFSESMQQIDGRYLFGEKSSVNKNDIIFTIGPDTGDPIEVKSGGGCLIATAAFGSEMAPQVQFLREIRDNTVLQTESGTTFMTGFNQFYYSFSPAIADYERENVVFKETVKLVLTPMLTSLALLNYVDIDSEHEMLGYGIGVILLNIGMYFVAPAVIVMKIKKLI